MKRRYPVKKSFDYLHLIDLRDAMVQAVSDAKGFWLDYGAVVPVYAPFMPHARIDTADIACDPVFGEPTYVFSAGRPCPAPTAHFDGVLSTQVLEHVEEPGKYLADVHRLLRPDGMLILSTHGVWEDHPLPGDFTRWTAQGLQLLLEDAGFEVASITPLTCGLRGLTALTLAHLRFVPRRAGRRYLGPLMTALVFLANSLAELFLAADKMRPEGGPGPGRFYVALLATCYKR